MKPTQAQLEKLEKDVNGELNERSKNENWEHEPITDGVVTIDGYLSAQPRMLWILKEAYDSASKEGKGNGGGWSVTELLAKNPITRTPVTWARMAYISHAVLNGFLTYNDMKYVDEDPAIGNSLKSIAYINIKKCPGKSTSYRKDISNWYQRYRDLLFRQINTICPEVIICGGTMEFLRDDFGLNEGSFHKGYWANFCQHGDRLYIGTYHPQYPRSEDCCAQYINAIVEIIKNHYQPRL